MTFNARKAGHLVALALLVTSAPSLQARSLWKTLFGAAATVAGWCTGQTAPVLPLEPPVPVPAARGNPGGDYPWVWLDSRLGLAEGSVSSDGRPYPWQPLMEAPASYDWSHLPPCIAPQKLPSLHATLDQAVIHYPASKCPGPIREHLPHERSEPGPAETDRQLVDALGDYDACRHYELATATRLETLDLEVACALRSVRELKRKDRGLQLVERLEDAARLHDDLVVEMHRCRRMVLALGDALAAERRRAAGAVPARVEDEPARRDVPPLDERLALAEWLHAEMEVASRRFHRKVLPALIAMLPAGPDRDRLRHGYCERLQAEHFSAAKTFRFLPGRPPYKGYWQMNPLMK